MKKVYGIISIFFASIICFGCSNSDTSNNNDMLQEATNITDVNVTIESQTEVQSTESSTPTQTPQSEKLNSYIINKKFADLILENNPIDNIYNATEIPYDTEGCIKLACTFRKYWWKEMDYTYNQLYDVLDSESRQALEESQEAWEKAFDSTDTIQKNLYYNNKYSVQGSFDKVLMNDLQMENVRYRAIKLKEYYYIVTGELDFQFKDNESESNIDSQIRSLTYSVPSPIIVATDVENNPIDSAYYLMNANDMDKQIEMLCTYQNYWQEEMNYTYNQLYDVLDSEDRQALEESQRAWETDIYNQNILQNNLYINNKYSKSDIDETGELYKLQMEIVRYRALELKEYYYVITGGEVDFGKNNLT